MADSKSPNPSLSNTPHRTSSGAEDVERAFMLREVMDHVVETTKASPAQRRRARGWVAATLCVLLFGASAYSWIARPEQIWGPSGQAPSPTIDRASARLTLAIIAQRLHDWRTQEGQYPLALTEMGEPVAGVSYELVGDTGFVLTTVTANDTIALRSSEPIEQFLGRSVDLIIGQRR